MLWCHKAWLYSLLWLSFGWPEQRTQSSFLRSKLCWASFCAGLLIPRLLEFTLTGILKHGCAKFGKKNTCINSFKDDRRLIKSWWAQLSFIDKHIYHNYKHYRYLDNDRHIRQDMTDAQTYMGHSMNLGHFASDIFDLQ